MKNLASIIVVVAGLLMAMPGVTEARIEFSYDLDSAIDQSQIFVEGEVTRVVGKDKDFTDYGLVEIRVTAIIRDAQGTPKVAMAKGDIVTAWIDAKLATGDHLFLLAKTRGKGQQSAMPDTTVWLPVTSGVYRLTNGRVEGELRYGDDMSEQGGHVTTRPAGTVTEAEFRTRINGALAEVKAIHEALDKAVAQHDGRAMVELLKRRGRPWNGMTHFPLMDPLEESIGEALGKLQDFDALGEALMIKDLPGREFVRSFATPEGVDYLLKKIGEITLAQERRLAYIWALPYARDFYAEAKNAETGYVARVAQLALDNIGETEITRGLAYHLAWLPEGKDTKQAIAILQKLYKQTDAEAVRHTIELICAKYSDEAFAALGSPCDRRLIVSAHYCDPTAFRVHRPREIGVTMDYLFFLPEGSPKQEVAVRAVAESMDNKRTYTVELADDYLGTKFLGPGGGTNTLTADLPADAPAGRYRMTVYFSAGGKSWGATRSFEGMVK